VVLGGCRRENAMEASANTVAAAAAIQIRTTIGCYTSRVRLSTRAKARDYSPTPMPAKIDSVNTISQKVRELRESGKKVVFTNGCFDVLHAGHVDFLQRAKELGDVLVVAINTDSSVQRMKGCNRPIIPEDERAELLAGLSMVDFVFTFDEDTPLQAIIKVHPDVLVKGADWGINDIVGGAEIEGWGGKVLALPLIEGKSTTGIVERVVARYGNPGKKNS
jgi:rfaE bifunctional protein nucleotidyltransferase chain/domain